MIPDLSKMPLKEISQRRVLHGYKCEFDKARFTCGMSCGCPPWWAKFGRKITKAEELAADRRSAWAKQVEQQTKRIMEMEGRSDEV